MNLVFLFLHEDHHAMSGPQQQTVQSVQPVQPIQGIQPQAPQSQHQQLEPQYHVAPAAVSMPPPMHKAEEIEPVQENKQPIVAEAELISFD